MNQCCKTCALWNRQAAMTANGRIRNDRVARCLWQSTEVYPISVDKQFGNIRPKAGYTVAADGVTCPCWVPRDEIRTKV